MIDYVAPQWKGRKPFRFEAMWVGSRGCEVVISDSCRGGDSSNSIELVRSALSPCSRNLTVWNSTQFGNIKSI